MEYNQIGFIIILILCVFLFSYNFVNNSLDISKFFTNLSPFLLYVLTNR
jgi:hypothetical protein